ncbi:motile sperm domain-containing protein 2-like [Oppia nitens]|uniref:motile sperm domain-containing protein 2-like n=1 Tax=Oppia nitens TaxID=1686743 RepID=UPI0023DC5795|nr:motile sperm domain-containing protein 2-like [Oppia nitens]
MESSDPILIGKVRDLIGADIRQHLDLYDSDDSCRVLNNDWQIQRFLLANKLDVDASYIMLRDALRWRHSYGVNKRTDGDYPQEFYKTGIYFPYGLDKEQRTVIYLRIKMYKSFPNVSDFFKQFIIHMINKVDIESDQKGWSMVWDLSGAGPSNWDLSMVKFIISSFKLYFPRGLQYLIVYGVPWIMNPFVSIALRLMSEETRNKVKFASKDQIFEYIDRDQVPDFLDGKCDLPYRDVPKEADREFRDMAPALGYSVQEVDQVYKHYDKYLN